MGALYDKDWRYSLARIWCDDAIRSMFNNICSEGKENVPTDGAVILAPNHCNTVMDALVILQDWKDATLFGARADVFRKPLVRKIRYSPSQEPVMAPKLSWTTEPLLRKLLIVWIMG